MVRAGILNPLINSLKELVETVQSLLPPIHFETHVDFKRRLPTAIGLIRTAEASSYPNAIIESA